MPLKRFTVNVAVLEQCLADARMPQRELADRLGVHESAVSRVLNRREPASANMVLALEEIFPDANLRVEYHETAATTAVAVTSE